jgi:dCMP deaminase
MGDMADYYEDIGYEQYLDGYDESPDCYSHKYSMFRGGRRKPTCKYCGKPDLNWRCLEGRWVLFETNDRIHNCKDNPQSIQTLKSVALNKINKVNNMGPDFLKTTGMEFTNEEISWEQYFLKMAYLVASKSKDPKTKIGAVLVKDKRVISTGYNGLCKGVNDNIYSRWQRPEKYKWISHAEENSILAAARYGIATDGTTLYTNATPCDGCCKSIIQAGISTVVVHKRFSEIMEQSVIKPQWKNDSVVNMMFEEAEVELVNFDTYLETFAYFDGRKYLV